MSVGRICTRTTHLAVTDESVRTAARRMEKENVGTLVVVDPDDRPIGIVTDRDVALRAVAAGLDADQAKVEAIMTAHPRTVEEDTPIERAVSLMRDLGVRRIPVVDTDERLVGILSVDDVLELTAAELGQLGKVVDVHRRGQSAVANIENQG